jgi:hypothetical protein
VAGARLSLGFGEPLHVAHQGPCRRVAERVPELVDDIRARLQEKVYDTLVNRKGAS